MENDAPLKQLGKIAQQIRSILHTTEVDLDDTVVRKMTQSILRNLEIAHKFLHDYESEEDVRLQALVLPQGIARLETLRKNILDASQYNLFGAVDVAHLTATIDQLIERLR